jgi:hypothetical protein
VTVGYSPENASRVVAVLPPYHYILNPIELLRSQLQVCVCVARRNLALKLREVRKMAEAPLGDFNGERWQDVTHHVIQEEQRKWELQALLM